MIRFKSFFCFSLALTRLFHTSHNRPACTLRPLVTGLFLAVVVHLCPQVVQAALLMDFTGGNANTFGGNATVGWEFTLSSPMLVDGLGFWDHAGNGLINAHDVGIWNTSNTALLLTSTTVTNGSSTAVASTSATGRWLFNNISPITLAPGTYVVGATIIASDADSQRFNATASMLSGATFVQARNVGSVGLAYPTPSPVFNDGVFGPNIRGTLVPEPSVMLLLLLAATAHFASTRKKRN